MARHLPPCPGAPKHVSGAPGGPVPRVATPLLAHVTTCVPLWSTDVLYGAHVGNVSLTHRPSRHILSSIAQTTTQTHIPSRQAMDYTDRAYWNGLIKMSLSKFFILCVLQTRPMHGYEITRAVERTTNGCGPPAEGTIYPVLREFEQGGYVTAHTEVVQGRQRKIYAITERGRAAFQVAVKAWMEVTQCLVQNECMTGEIAAAGTGCR